MARVRRETIQKSHDHLVCLTTQWKRVSRKGSLIVYLFQRGIFHLLIRHNYQEVQQLLSEYDFLMERLKYSSSQEIFQIVKEVLTIDEITHINGDFQVWKSFFCEKSSLISMGTNLWSSPKIFFQLCMEHADKSPLTIAAENWYQQGKCTWNWLRKNSRPKDIVKTPLVLTYSGHSESITKLVYLNNRHFISLDQKGHIAVWNFRIGRPVFFHEARSQSICTNIQRWHSDRFIGFSKEGGIFVYSIYESEPLQIIPNGGITIYSCIILNNEIFATTTKEGHIYLWEFEQNSYISKVQHPCSKNLGSFIGLSTKQYLSWSRCGTIQIWNFDNQSLSLHLSFSYEQITSLIVLEQGLVAIDTGKSTKIVNLDNFEIFFEVEGTLVDAHIDYGVLVTTSSGELDHYDIQNKVKKKTYKGFSDHFNMPAVVSNANFSKDGQVALWGYYSTLFELGDVIYQAQQMTPAKADFTKAHMIQPDVLPIVVSYKDGEVGKLPESEYSFGIEADEHFLSAGKDGKIHLWDLHCLSATPSQENDSILLQSQLISEQYAIGWEYYMSDAITGNRYKPFSLELSQDTLSVHSFSPSSVIALQNYQFKDVLIEDRFFESGIYKNWILTDQKTKESVEFEKMHLKGLVGMYQGKYFVESELKYLLFTDIMNRDIQKKYEHPQPLFDVIELPNGLLYTQSVSGSIGVVDFDTLSYKSVIHREYINDTIKLHNIFVVDDNHLLLLFPNLYSTHKQETYSIKDPCKAYLYHIEKHEFVGAFEGHEDEIISACVLHETEICTWSKDNTILIWNWKTQEQIYRYKYHVIEAIDEHSIEKLNPHQLYWLSNTSILIEAKNINSNHLLIDTEVQLLDTKTNSVRIFKSGYTDTKWDYKTKENIDIKEVVQGIVHIQDSVVFLYTQHRMYRWETIENQIDVIYESFDKKITINVIYKDEYTLIINPSTGEPFIWSMVDEQKTLLSRSVHIKKMIYCTNNRIVSLHRNVIYLYDMNFNVIHEFYGHTRDVLGTKQLKNGRLLSWSLDSTIRIWNLESAECICILKPSDISRRYENQNVLAMNDFEYAIRPYHKLSERNHNKIIVTNDNRILTFDFLSRSANQKSHNIIMWDAPTQKIIGTFVGHTSAILGIKLLSKGRMLSWDQKGDLYIWSLKNTQVLSVLKGHKEAIIGVKEIDEQQLLSWGADEQFIFWNHQSGEKQSTISFDKARDENPSLFVESKIWIHNQSKRVYTQSNVCTLYDEQFQQVAIWIGDGTIEGQFITQQDDIYIIENQSSICHLKLFPPSVGNQSKE